MNKKLLKLIAGSLDGLGSSCIVTGIFASALYETVGIIQLQMGLGFTFTGLIAVISGWVLSLYADSKE